MARPHTFIKLLFNQATSISNRCLYNIFILSKDNCRCFIVIVYSINIFHINCVLLLLLITISAYNRKPHPLRWGFLICLRNLNPSGVVVLHPASLVQSEERNHHRVQACCSHKAICKLQEFHLASYRGCAQPE